MNDVPLSWKVTPEGEEQLEQLKSLGASLVDDDPLVVAEVIIKAMSIGGLDMRHATPEEEEEISAAHQENFHAFLAPALHAKRRCLVYAPSKIDMDARPRGLRTIVDDKVIEVELLDLAAYEFPFWRREQDRGRSRTIAVDLDLNRDMDLLRQLFSRAFDPLPVGGHSGLDELATKHALEQTQRSSTIRLLYRTLPENMHIHLFGSGPIIERAFRIAFEVAKCRNLTGYEY